MTIYCLSGRERGLTVGLPPAFACHGQFPPRLGRASVLVFRLERSPPGSASSSAQEGSALPESARPRVCASRYRAAVSALPRGRAPAAAAEAPFLQYPSRRPLLGGGSSRRVRLFLNSSALTILNTSDRIRPHRKIFGQVAKLADALA